MRKQTKLTPLVFGDQGQSMAVLKDEVAQPKFAPEPVAATPFKASPSKAPPTKPPVEKPIARQPRRAEPTRTTSDLPPWARYAYWVAVPAALLWAGAMAAFASGYQNPFGPFEYRPFPIAAFAGLCLLPAIFILLSAYAVRQAAHLTGATHHARDLASDLAIPAALAADQAGGAAQAVRREIDRISQAAQAAEAQILSLRKALSEEGDQLLEAAQGAERRAHALSQELARERGEMNDLSRALDAQVLAVTDAIATQSRMVADAADLAATQMQESQSALTGRAADLAAAAGDMGDTILLATDGLGGKLEQFQSAGEAICAQIDDTQTALSNEHDRLSALSRSLQEDQERIAAQIDAQRTTLLTASADARSSAVEFAEVSTQSTVALGALLTSVTEQVDRLAVTAEVDERSMREQAQANLKLFTGVVAEERAQMEAHTRAALDALSAASAKARQSSIDHADEAQDRIEQLGQAAFAAGRKADEAFEQRMSTAKAMIEQSAGLVDDAGRRSAERIEASLSASHSAMDGLTKLLDEVDVKVAALPEDAKVRAQSMRQAVEQGIGDMTEAARKAAEETQAIDAAFQRRIKHNYEVLSEALRLMGQVAGATDAAAKASTSAPTRASALAPAPAPAPVQAPEALKPKEPAPAPKDPVPETPRVSAASVDPQVGLAPPPADAAPKGEVIGLRPRLKLTADTPAPPPVEAAAPARASPVEAAPPVRAAPLGEPLPVTVRKDANDWTWKDLLSSIDEPPMDDEVLAERLISEIEALGLDAPALLPLARIDEIAAIMQTAGATGASDLVRKFAPSAVRRLSRRVLTDKVLRAHADRYVQRYEELLNDSAARDRDGFVTATLLGSDPGRAYLLFNAAVGELH